ncbi:MAG: tRNA lysidine(34) synthetase TilS [Candidatus Omnitrophica bacterium]|nr:tRNA lysidine(34) synthetase TilS [Candidatus Omnitrophota bacterium]
MIRQVKETIKRHQLISHGDSILIGVSGGPDSIFLLHILHELRHDLGIKLFAGHVNHQIHRRSLAHQKFVERTCQKLQIPFQSVAVKIMVAKGSSLEEAAREERFKALIQIARKLKATTIALGQHQNDVAETVLMRILRGSGLLGLQGILPRRTIYGMRVIRPLIHLQKAEIETWLAAKRISYRQDPTNQQTKFFRNKVRKELLPLLQKKYNPNIIETLSHLSENVVLDYEYLQLQAEAALKSVETERGLRMEPLRQFHLSLVRLMIRLKIQKIQGHLRRIELAHINEIEDLIKNRPDGAVVNLPYGIEVKKNKFILQFQQLKKRS